MENLLSGIKIPVVYQDDIIITGKSNFQHIKTLKLVLKNLHLAGAKICVLGCTIDEHGLSVSTNVFQVLCRHLYHIAVNLNLSLEWRIIIRSLFAILVRKYFPYMGFFKKNCHFLWSKESQKGYKLI